jgi:signal peptidase II
LKEADVDRSGMIIPRRLRWLWLTLGVVFLDRASKAWIESRPASFFPHTVIAHYFEIVYSRNTGIAFSFLSDASSPAMRYLLIAGSVLIIGAIAWLLVGSHQMNAGSAAGLALLLAGATGNVTDRMIHGAVTDFLEVWLRFLPWPIFNPWPTFNVADSAVSVGALLIIFDVLFREQSPPKSPSSKTIT